MPDTFFTFIETLNWRTGLDILLLSIMVFLVYRTVQTMGTWKIAGGIVTGVAVFGLAAMLDLPAVEWIFSNLSSVFVLGLIIIFQPEIRRFLERAHPFRRRDPEGNTSDLTRILTETLFSLAERKWGAIIVLPGKNPLKQWLSGGVMADAVPSIPLLMSIFDPDSPGHDGAVILDKNRLIEFAVRLPLSQTARLGPEFGTRHHAAMGLSEAVDSLIFVVSEERGIVSSFHNGKMQGQATESSIGDSINEHYKKNDTRLKPLLLRKRRWRPLMEILLSAVFATFIWIMVVLGLTQTREMFFSVPIEYSPPPVKLTLTGDPPTVLKVHLSGPISSLSSLDLSQLRVLIDLSEGRAGKQKISVSGTNVIVPRNLRVIDVYPSTIDLELKEFQELELKVTPQLIGNLPDKLVMESINVSPASIKSYVYADEFVKVENKELLTTPVFLENVHKSTIIFAKIVAPHGFQPVDKRWPDVQIKLSIIDKSKP